MKTISKSSFIRGTKCPKSLWLHFFQPEVRDEISTAQQAIFDTGHNVGFYAQQLFPGGIDASRGQHDKVAEAVEYTQELIRKGCKVIYEAAFGNRSTLCYMDILVNKRGKWHAYEVKSTNSVKDYHILDVAFQYFVITRSGLPLEGISLIHLNREYIRRGDLDLQQLFTIESMTGDVRPLQAEIPVQLKTLQVMLAEGKAPKIEMGRHCTKPWECDFMEYCSGTLLNNPESSIQHPASRDQAALNAFKSQLVSPLHFLDFETIMPAVPLHDESRPYQQIPFQYSLHVLDGRKNKKERASSIQHPASLPDRQSGSIRYPATSIQHQKFLGTPPADPRPEFINSLLNHLGTSGSIVVWNQAFEMTRLKEIARDFPKYASRIEKLFERFVDLMVPFRKRHLYTPEMNGSYSLKAVLPALISDLSYSDLEIQEGGTASLTYESLYIDPDPESVVVKRENLLKYCEMDTWSMVRIMEKL